MENKNSTLCAVYRVHKYRKLIRKVKVNWINRYRERNRIYLSILNEQCSSYAKIYKWSQSHSHDRIDIIEWNQNMEHIDLGDFLNCSCKICTNSKSRLPREKNVFAYDFRMIVFVFFLLYLFQSFFSVKATKAQHYHRTTATTPRKICFLCMCGVCVYVRFRLACFSLTNHTWKIVKVSLANVCFFSFDAPYARFNMFTLVYLCFILFSNYELFTVVVSLCISAYHIHLLLCHTFVVLQHQENDTQTTSLFG